MKLTKRDSSERLFKKIAKKFPVMEDKSENFYTSAKYPLFVEDSGVIRLTCPSSSSKVYLIVEEETEEGTRYSRMDLKTGIVSCNKKNSIRGCGDMCGHNNFNVYSCENDNEYETMLKWASRY